MSRSCRRTSSRAARSSACRRSWLSRSRSKMTQSSYQPGSSSRLQQRRHPVAEPASSSGRARGAARWRRPPAPGVDRHGRSSMRQASVDADGTGLHLVQPPDSRAQARQGVRLRDLGPQRAGDDRAGRGTAVGQERQESLRAPGRSIVTPRDCRAKPSSSCSRAPAISRAPRDLVRRAGLTGTRVPPSNVGRSGGRAHGQYGPLPQARMPPRTSAVVWSTQSRRARPVRARASRPGRRRSPPRGLRGVDACADLAGLDRRRT